LVCRLTPPTSLQDNDIRAEGARALGEGLKMNSTLTSLKYVREQENGLRGCVGCCSANLLWFVKDATTTRPKRVGRSAHGMIEM
jgi:hypothetical protein